MRIVDSHTHLMNGNPDKLLQMADSFGYEKFGVMAIPCDPGFELNTLECMLLKLKDPEKVYCYGGMAYFKDQPATKQDHEKQLQLMMDAGCDGWKLLESKPSVYRELQLPLDGEVFAGAFGMAEEAQLPLIWHAGDPATFWSAETAPRFAVENGWLCVGEGFPTLEQLYTQVENVLARHPKLRTSMAHLYFTSDDRSHAERLLEQYENFWLDICPGSEMYHAFLADREGWGAFFRKYQDKLVFGTDMVDDEGDVVFGSQNSITEFVMKTLASKEPFAVRDIAGTGLGLEEEVLRKIFAENFERRNGVKPKPISRKGVEAYAEWLMPKLNADMRKKCEELMK